MGQPENNVQRMSDPGQHTNPNGDAWPSWATETIRIHPPDPAWPETAARARQELNTQLSSLGSSGIEHIGSTAVPGLAAKPIIDFLATVPSFDEIEAIARALRHSGWHYVPPELDQRPERRFFIKVENDHRTAHLQLLLPGSARREEQIRFRDRLILDQTLRNEYAALKRSLAEEHGDDREAYTQAKSEFIKRALGPIKIPVKKPIKIIFATNNAHKVEEIQSAIGGALDVISLRAAGIDIDIPEPHDTLEANATEKSSTIHRLTGANCFSEDTGLEVTALNGEPGVKSARYAGEGRAFEKNIEKLLSRLAAAPNRRARFRTVISLIWDGKEYLFEGICEGHILPAPTGEGGFGYDPIFVPDGDTRSFAQMSMEEKNRYSHRRKAADQLVAFLQGAARPHF
jgi:XTP/dITP diphosphohydrolase